MNICSFNIILIVFIVNNCSQINILFPNFMNNCSLSLSTAVLRGCLAGNDYEARVIHCCPYKNNMLF